MSPVSFDAPRCARLAPSLPVLVASAVRELAADNYSVPDAFSDDPQVSSRPLSFSLCLAALLPICCHTFIQFEPGSRSSHGSHLSLSHSPTTIPITTHAVWQLRCGIRISMLALLVAQTASQLPQQLAGPLAVPSFFSFPISGRPSHV